MATLAELIKQREELEQAISSLQHEARADAIAKVRALMADHGLSIADIAGKPSRPAVASEERRTVAVKYRDKSGNAWSGRGLKPKWLVAALATGKSLDDFRV